ncbi:I78 family peptidase inhibitor [Roseovarius salis]|uniref:I78 family peptidase inhibitor n=1 Tax=Roseovarius salis TaxID=3376063 RepID=UPI0037C85B2A
MRFALAATVFLAACMSEEEAPAPDPTPERDACGASELQHLVGQPAAEHAFGTGSQQVRVIPPGLSVTMDYVPDRLNVETDENGIIKRIYCG